MSEYYEKENDGYYIGGSTIVTCSSIATYPNWNVINNTREWECKYCGTINPTSSCKCGNCSAPRKR